MESDTQTTGAEPYPVQFAVEYPDRDLNPLTTGFRLIVAIPILIVAATVGGRAPGPGLAAATGGVLFLSPLLMIIIRQKYPRWWYDWTSSCESDRRLSRAEDDRYPSSEERQAVALDFP